MNRQFWHDPDHGVVASFALGLALVAVSIVIILTGALLASSAWWLVMRVDWDVAVR